MKPSLLTADWLASNSKLSIERINYLADNIGDLVYGPVAEYVKGKRRDIYKPKREEKRDLRKIHRALTRCKFEHDAAQGGVKGRSCVNAAQQHMGTRAQCVRDISNCYPSITFGELQAALLDRGFNPDTATLLTKLMTIDGRVPQGLPLSSDALNLFMYSIDLAMSQFAKSVGGSYTRTYDDMVASAPKTSICKKIERKLDDLLDKFPLEVNEKKKLDHGFSHAHEPRRVHNINVNSPTHLSLSKDQKEKAIDLAASYVRSARSVSPDSLRALAKKRQKLCGWLSYERQVNSKTSRHIQRLLQDGDRLVLQSLSAEGITPHKNQWYFGAVNRKLPHPYFSKMIDQWKQAKSTDIQVVSNS